MYYIVKVIVVHTSHPGDDEFEPPSSTNNRNVAIGVSVPLVAVFIIVVIVIAIVILHRVLKSRKKNGSGENNHKGIL